MSARQSPRRAAMTALFIRLAPVASGIVNYTQILGLTGVDYGAAVILAAELINSLAVDFRTGVRWCVHFAVSCQTPSRVSTERRPLRIEASFAVVKPPKSGPAASSLHHTSPHPPSLDDTVEILTWTTWGRAAASSSLPCSSRWQFPWPRPRPRTYNTTPGTTMAGAATTASV